MTHAHTYVCTLRYFLHLDPLMTTRTPWGFNTLTHPLLIWTSNTIIKHHHRIKVIPALPDNQGLCNDVIRCVVVID